MAAIKSFVGSFLLIIFQVPRDSRLHHAESSHAFLSYLQKKKTSAESWAIYSEAHKSEREKRRKVTI